MERRRREEEEERCAGGSRATLLGPFSLCSGGKGASANWWW